MSKSIGVDMDSERLVYAEAYELKALVFKMVEDINNTEDNSDSYIGKIISFNILTGLAIEIYLKLFMIAGRKGRVTQHHSLEILYEEFPDFIKKHLEKKYMAFMEKDKSPYPVCGVKLNNLNNDVPGVNKFEISFSSFENAISTFSNFFIKYRYIYEKISSQSWEYVHFPFNFAKATLDALEISFKDYRSNQIAKPNI